jgi:hypothetical protein
LSESKNRQEVVVPWKWQVLVIANVTAGSEELLAAMKQRAARQPTSFHLVIPATSSGGGQTAATETLRDALERFREEGLEADGVVGRSDPATAAIEAWDPRRYDEIIVSTLPMRVSKWLRAGLPARVDRLTGALVTHVVSQPPIEAPKARPAPAHEKPDPVIGALSVLNWGPHNHKEHGRRPVA